MSLAVNDLNKAAELQRDNAAAYNNLGNVYGNDGDFNAAIGNYSKAIELSPDDPIFYHNRGLAYFNNNEFSRAREDYTRVLRLDSDYAPAYYNRAMAWLHQREWKKAQANLTLAGEKGMDIAAVFRSDYQSITGFEKKADVKLPKDIAAMLSLQEENLQTKPMEESPFQPPSGIDPRPFKNISAMLPEQENNPFNFIYVNQFIAIPEWN